MLKQTIAYTDFDDNDCQETLYFNLTKSELADNLHLQEDLSALKNLFAGERVELKDQEIKSIIDLVKTFMRLSYGVRSADGKRFIKTADIWEEFTQTAAYDAFLFSLFENPEKAVRFMTGILPKDLRIQVEEEVRKDDLTRKFVEREQELPQVSATPETSVKMPPANLTAAEMRQWLTENPDA